MEYFTAQEARQVIGNASVHLCTAYEHNPNREAFATAVSMAEQARYPTVYLAVMQDFALGMATGVRQERARRRDHVEANKEDVNHG